MSQNFELSRYIYFPAKNYNTSRILLLDRFGTKRFLLQNWTKLFYRTSLIQIVNWRVLWKQKPLIETCPLEYTLYY